MSVSFLRRFSPVLTFLLFGVIAFVLWREQGAHEDQLVQRHLENAVEQATIRIDGMMKARIACLELLGARWVDRTPPDFSRERFLSFAQAAFEHYPGFVGIYWVDPDGLIQWGFPEDTAASCKRVYDHPDAGYRDVFHKASGTGEPSVTPSIDIYEGGKGFEVFLPLIHDGRLQGYMRGVFRMERIVAMALPQSIKDDFEIGIYEGGSPVFVSRATSGPGFRAEKSLVAQDVVRVGDRIWKLRMRPTDALYSPGAFRNLPYLAFGLALSGALAMLHFLLLRRMDEYRQSRDQALFEVSERRKAEEALKEKEKTLQGLLNELSAKNAEMESFVYTISHDLKTPIVTIDGFIGALREDFGPQLPEEAEGYLKYMSDAAKKMESLINDLLDLSRIGRVSGKMTPVPFGDLVEDALNILRPQIEARRIAMSVQPDLPEVNGERKRLGQMVYNLLNNAVKYVGEGNPAPRIEVGTMEGGEVFFIRDNGIGIDEKYFGKIFQIFERLPSARKEEGTGIGLTIVKRVIEFHGGKIWLDSKLGTGTTFFFTLKKDDYNP
ncbi:MAG: sensor histidine kinase [Acidobacteriota bacterium]